MNSVLHVKGLFIWGITVKTIKQQAMQFQADHVLGFWVGDCSYDSSAQ